MKTPNYENPSKNEYLELVNHEGFIIQMAELMNKVGEHQEARVLNQEKKHVQIRRKCLEAALKKEKQQVLPINSLPTYKPK